MQLWSAIIWVAVMVWAADAYAAEYPYLNDANVQPDAPKVTGNYPKVSLTETQSVLGSEEQWSKYDVIGGKSGMSSKIARIQAINPKVKFLFSFHPRSYLGYRHNQPCEIAMGMPFNETAASTGGCAVYAGHWLYRAGTRLQSSISAGQLTLQVQDASRLTAGQYAVIYNSPAGSFANAEHVRIASVNKSAGQVTLSRRGFKSRAVAHGNNSIVAMHEQGRGNHPENWAYNLAPSCPRDASNRTVAQVMAQWIPANMRRSSTGQITGARVDGVYFDEDAYFLYADTADVNNDLVVDNGIVNGSNAWGEGLERFYQLVRDRLPGLWIVGGYRETHGFAALNGVQMENWLVTRGDFDPDPAYGGNGGALSQMHNYLIHTQYHRTAEGYTEALSKNPTRLYPYTVQSGSRASAPDNTNFRFGFGAVLLGDGYYARQNSDAAPDPWYDEYSVDVDPKSNRYGYASRTNSQDEAEARAHKGWLGRPLGPRRRIYDTSTFAPQQSLIANGGFEDGMTSWQTQNLDVTLDSSAKVQGSRSLRIDRQSRFSADLGGAVVKGPAYNMVRGQRYTLAFAAKSSRMRDITVRADWSSNQGLYLVPDRWTRYVYTVTAQKTGTFRPIFYLGREDTKVWIDDVYVFEGDPNVFRRDYENGIVVVNATPSSRRVDLGGRFLRIHGTGQDAVNNGATVTDVTLPDYDAAILVRPQGTSSTAPPPSGGGSAGPCGAPDIDLTDAPAMYAWADTCTAGLYHLTATSNGSFRGYDGTVTAGGSISNLTKHMIEANDEVQVAGSSLQFGLSVWNGEDTLSFSVPKNAAVCLRLTTGRLLTGPDASGKSGAIDLRTMQPCGSTSVVGAPTDATTDNPGLYAWVDESGIYHVRGTSDGPRRDFTGTVQVDGAVAINDVESLEPIDSVTAESDLIDFDLKLWNGVDGFSFRPVTDGPVCLAITTSSGGPILFGKDAEPTGRSVNMRSGGSCT